MGSAHGGPHDSNRSISMAMRQHNNDEFAEVYGTSHESQSQSANMTQLEMDNEENHAQRKGVILASNIKKSDAFQTQFDAELEAQRFDNATNKAINSKKVCGSVNANIARVHSRRVQYRMTTKLTANKTLQRTSAGKWRPPLEK